MVASRSALMLTFLVGLLSLAGCRLCTDCEDEAYPTYGGIWQRTDRFNGRVGSVFAPAGAKIERPTARAGDGLDNEVAPGEDATDSEDDFEVLPPGDRRPDESENPPIDNQLDDAEIGDPEDAELEEVRLQQPLGNPHSSIGY